MALPGGLLAAGLCFPKGASANFCDPYHCTCNVNMARRKNLKVIVSFVHGDEHDKHVRRATRGGELDTRCPSHAAIHFSKTKMNRVVKKPACARFPPSALAAFNEMRRNSVAASGPVAPMHQPCTCTNPTRPAELQATGASWHSGLTFKLSSTCTFQTPASGRGGGYSRPPSDR